MFVAIDIVKRGINSLVDIDKRSGHRKMLVVYKSGKYVKVIIMNIVIEPSLVQWLVTLPTTLEAQV